MRITKEIVVPEHKKMQTRVICDDCNKDLLDFMASVCEMCKRDLCDVCAWNKVKGLPIFCRSCSILMEEKEKRIKQIDEEISVERELAINSISAKRNQRVMDVWNDIKSRIPVKPEPSTSE